MNLFPALGSDNLAVKMWMRLKAIKGGCRLSCGPYAWDLSKDERVIRIGREQFGSVGHLTSQFDSLFDTLEATKAGGQTLLDFSRVRRHKYRVSGVTFELAKWPEPDAAIDAYFEWYEPQRKDLVFDLGAECGVSTYVLSRLAGTVVAFEPDVRMRVILERNVERHELSNVIVTRDTMASLSELIAMHGPPAFCKVNLDELPQNFIEKDAQSWLALPIVFAVRSRSTGLRRLFDKYLKESGFETASNDLLGVSWARRTTYVPA